SSRRPTTKRIYPQQHSLKTHHRPQDRLHHFARLSFIQNRISRSQRLRQSAPNFQRHTQTVRRLEHRPRHPRPHDAHHHRRPRHASHRRPTTQNHPRHSHLAVLKIHARHLPRRPC